MTVDGGRRARAWVPAGYSLVLALIVVGPLLGSGYLLLRDAVSTPRSYLTDAALGVGDAAPRAVPQDALVATLSTVIDGGIVVKAILVAALWLAGWGAAALAREFVRAGVAAQLVAATIAIWNPYVAERLLQGHWSLLTGYAALPWIALLANRIRTMSDMAAGRTLRVHGLAADGRTAGSRGAAHATTDPTPPNHRTPHGTTVPTDPDHRTAHTAAEQASRAHRTSGASDGEAAQPQETSDTADDQTARKWGTSRVAGDRVSRARAWCLLAGFMGAAGLTPTGSLLAGLVALLLVGRRNLLGTVALWVASAAPWLMATALSGAGAEPSDPAGVAAFAARAEPGLGTLGSLAGLGGIWNSTAVPGSRTTYFALFATLILLVIVAFGVRRVVTGSDEFRRPRRILVALAVFAIVLPALGATGWGIAVGEFLVAHIPGTGLLRDTQKYVALAMPAFALCAAASCRTVGEKLTRATTSGRAAPTDAADAPAPSTATTGLSATKTTETGAAPQPDRRTPYIAALFIALLIATLPDLAWGVGGTLRPVHYPPAWQRVAELVEPPGDVAVLPGGMFRKFPYSGSAPVLDPAPRMLTRDVLQTGELPVRWATVSGEGTRAREVERLLLRGGSAAELAHLGVGWVLVEGGTPGPLGESKTTLAQLEPAFTDPDLQLYSVPGPIADHDASPTSRRLAGAAHLLWAVLLAGFLVTMTPNRRTRGTSSART
ncbi:hypothetical protein [Nocardia sp. NPDC050406]|uniref:hypothetical protein n=1 Tax=Nocardia sp. NPDC050406 TaxID=3364318 RepID=UPI0037AD6DF4